MTTAPAIQKNIPPIITIGVMFFVFGFATWINAMLIPYFKLACELSNLQSYFVTFAFYISYLVVAVPASFLLNNIGFKNGMMVGFWIMAIGAFLFVPAASIRSYPIFLAGLFLIGIGLALLQTAANPYVSILGPKASAARRISAMGICNKTAGIIAPLLLAAVILKPGDQALFKTIPHLGEFQKAYVLNGLIRRVMLPYAIVGGGLLILGFVVRYSPLPEIENFNEEEDPVLGKREYSILKFPHLILGALAIFFHVGSQILAVDSIIGYAQGTGMPLIEAKVFPSFTLLATICGYIIGISVIPKIVSQLHALRACTLLGFLLSIAVIFTTSRAHFLGHHTSLSVWFLVTLGFANSMIWAGIWPLALSGLGKHLKLGASILVMGLCGNAIVPLFYGYLADKYNLQTGYCVLLPCYLYLIFFAFYGYRVKRWAVC